VNVVDYDDIRTVEADRNDGGRNTSLHTTSLVVPISELSKLIAQPTQILLQSRDVLRTPDEEFAGHTEYEYLYWRGGSDDRLQQKVAVTKIPPSVSGVLRSVSIERYVLDHFGDIIYGKVILNSSRVTDKLGIRLEYGDSVFLKFVPDKVF